MKILVKEDRHHYSNFKKMFEERDYGFFSKYHKIKNLDWEMDMPLPSPLPKGLVVLKETGGNAWKEEKLPDTLKKLTCTYIFLYYNFSLPERLEKLEITNPKNYKPYFVLPSLPPNLKTLIVPDLFLKKLPFLPKKLEHLACSNNDLTELPLLPESLINLSCCHNNLSSLSLPEGLRSVNCAGNNIKTIHFGSQLRLINISYTNIKELNISHCHFLEVLICTGCSLRKISSLPKGLEKLFCDHNKLISLPPLPESLRELNCNNNRLTSISFQKSNSNLKIAELNNNYLTSLEPLGINLQEMTSLNSLNILRFSCNPYLFIPYNFTLLGVTLCADVNFMPILIRLQKRLIKRYRKRRDSDIKEILKEKTSNFAIDLINSFRP